MRIDDLTIVRDTNEIVRGDDTVRVSPLAMDVLLALAEQATQVISQDALLQRFWHTDTATENALYKVISELRQAVGDRHRETKLIKTVPKRGYTLNAEVTLPNAPAATYSDAGDALITESLTKAEDALHNRMYLLTLKHARVAADLIAQSSNPDTRQALQSELVTGRALLLHEGRDAARSHFEKAAEIASLVQDHHSLCIALLGLSGGQPPLFAREDEDSKRNLKTALQRLGDADPELAILIRTRLLYYTPDRTENHLQTAQTLVEDARRRESPELLGEALVSLHAMLNSAEHLSTRTAVSNELLELVPRFVDRDLVASTFLRSCGDALCNGDIKRADALTQSFRGQQPASTYRDDLNRMSAARALMAGDLDTAEAMAMAVNSKETGPSLIQMLQLYHVYRFRGQQKELLPLIEALAAERPDIPIIKVFLALSYAEAADRAQCDDYLNKNHVREMRLAGDVSDPLMLATLIEVCLAVEDRQWARHLLPMVEPYAGQHLTQGAICYLGSGNWFIGRLKILLGGVEDGEALLAIARDEHHSVGASVLD